MLYSEDTWHRFVQKIERGYEIKKYLHFDHRFNFPQQKEKIKAIVSDANNVISHSYLPLLKMLIKTPRYRYQEEEGKYELETKIRPISFASHLDTYIYSFYSFALGEKYQEYIKTNGFDSSVLAYRSDLDGKCNIQFAKEVFEIIRGIGSCTAIGIDIKGYFDSIDHQTLKSTWCKVLGLNELPADQYKVFRSLTKYSYINKNSLLKHFNVDLTKSSKKELPATLTDIIPGKSFKEKFDLLREHNLIAVNETSYPYPDGKKRFFGIPQGSALSALLSNVYLVDFDKYMHEYSQKEGVIYRRYCDDILLIVPSGKTFEINDVIKDKISEYHLKIQSKKTEFVNFSYAKNGKLRGFDVKKLVAIDKFGMLSDETKFYKNLQYLGFEFSGQHIYIRPGSLSRYFRKMKARIVKTVLMWKGKNSKSPVLFKRQLYYRYTHLGERNFLTYAFNASKKYYKNAEGERKEGMSSPTIRKQISNHFDILLAELASKKKGAIKFKAKK
ncbi:MAG: antiviral reverse transcriptase Drt2 [Bacteroidia bacterium]